MQQRDQPGMHRQEAAHRRVGPAKLFVDQREAQVVHPGAAVLRRDRPGQEAQFGHALDQLQRELRRSSAACGERRDLLLGEGARERLDAR